MISCTCMVLLKDEVKHNFAYVLKMAACTVVDNFFILLLLKFHDFRPAGLRGIDLTSLLSAFACALNRSE